MGSETTTRMLITGALTRRRILGGAIAGVGMTLGLGRDARGQATPVGTPEGDQSGSGARYLFVGDRTQPRVAVYSIPDFTLAGTVEGVTFGTHAGTLLLPDGRLVFADTGTNEIVALRDTANGTPEISDRAAAEFGGGVSWMAADPSLRYVAVGSLQDNEEEQIVNILDLETFENTPVTFAMREPEEITPWLLGNPVHLYVAVGGEIQSFALDALLAGNTEPLGTVAVELGSHGGATDVENQRLYYVTASGTGFEVLDTAAGPAEYLTQIPWDVDDLSGGQNFRPRLTQDGAHIFGVMVPDLEDPTQWADAVVSNHVANLTDLSAKRIEIGTGNFGGRWGISDRYALWAGINADGGTVYLLDADATSPTFGEAVATMPIALPTNAAVPGQNPDGTNTYATAITADSRYGFVSINGDRLVKVFDLEAREEIAEIPIELPLNGYDGYLTVIETGITPVDVWGR